MSLTDWGVILPVIGGAVAWIFNGYRERVWERAKRKEDRYISLMESIHGFYVGAPNVAKKEEFIRQYQLGWLHCPDAVIKKINSFLETVKTGVKATDLQKESALRDLILELRNDLFKEQNIVIPVCTKKSRLKPSEFQFWAANN